MFASFLWFALAVATFFWVDKPWYYALPIAVCVFFGGALLRAIYQVATGSTPEDAVDKALRDVGCRDKLELAHLQGDDEFYQRHGAHTGRVLTGPNPVKEDLIAGVMAGVEDALRDFSRQRKGKKPPESEKVISDANLPPNEGDGAMSWGSSWSSLGKPKHPTEAEMRRRLFKLSQLRTSELRQEFAARGLDFSDLDTRVHAALVADAMVNDAATSFAKYRAWIASETTWEELTSDARRTGAPI
jgi:hypothetical protein